MVNRQWCKYFMFKKSELEVNFKITDFDRLIFEDVWLSKAYWKQTSHSSELLKYPRVEGDEYHASS